MRPTESDFHIWRHSEVGRWFFDEHLQEEVNTHRMNIGSGLCSSKDKDEISIAYANMVGFADGMESAIERDPYETEGHRETPPDQNGD